MPAITFKPRVKETSTTTGTGDITLAGAVVGYQSFDDAFVVTDDYFYYCIEGVDGSGVPTGQWEEGIGHLSASTTLVRDTLLASSTGSAVSFSAGTKNVFCTVAAGWMERVFCLDSNVVYNSVTTLADTPLALSLEIGTYTVEAYLLRIDEGNSAGLKAGFGGTATIDRSPGTWVSIVEGVMDIVAQADTMFEGTNFETYPSFGSVGSLTFKGSVRVTAAGTFALQGAQTASHADDVTIYAGSWMKVKRVA